MQAFAPAGRGEAAAVHVPRRTHVRDHVETVRPQGCATSLELLMIRRAAIALAGAAALGVGTVAPIAAQQDAVTTGAEIRRAEAPPSGEKRSVVERLRAQLRAERRRVVRLRRALVREDPGTPAERHLAAIAACESGDDPRALSGGGLYRGKHQFDLRTWRSVGGRGDPADATETEQDWRALLLYERRGTQPWPVCG